MKNKVMTEAELTELYSKEWEAYCDTMPTRELECMFALLDGGMTERDFVDHVVGINKPLKSTAQEGGADVT